MLKNRWYEPADGEVLYHYCTAETFLAICSYKTLRFSDLFSMNDFMELQWGHDVLLEEAEQLKDEIGEGLLGEIIERVQGARFVGYPLASCLSTDGDVLSQWRAYAGDGAGYAIGFDAKKLSSLPVRPLRVSYDREQQKNEIRTLLRAIHHAENTEPGRDEQGLTMICTHLSFDLAAYKNPAFSEEKEIRLVRLIQHESTKGTLKLTDDIGPVFNDDNVPSKIGFHLRGSTPVPHLDVDFSMGREEACIAEVVLGPKNTSTPLNIAIFLETLGIENVRVRKSQASYR